MTRMKYDPTKYKCHHVELLEPRQQTSPTKPLTVPTVKDLKFSNDPTSLWAFSLRQSESTVRHSHHPRGPSFDAWVKHKQELLDAEKREQSERQTLEKEQERRRREQNKEALQRWKEAKLKELRVKARQEKREKHRKRKEKKRAKARSKRAVAEYEQNLEVRFQRMQEDRKSTKENSSHTSKANARKAFHAWLVKKREQETLDQAHQRVLADIRERQHELERREKWLKKDLIRLAYSTSF